MATIIKKMNHNAVIINDNGVEKIVTGKGLGFSVKENEPFDIEKCEKIFILEDPRSKKLFMELISNIPMEYIDFTEKMICFIKKKLNKDIDPRLIITLTDHIYFAVSHQTDDKKISEFMLPEMRIIYTEEYQLASYIVAEMNREFSVQLGDNEKTFIALHIVNAEMREQNSKKSLKILELTDTILQVIKTHHPKGFDENSFNFNRLIIHLRFLCKRIVYHTECEEDLTDILESTFRRSSQYKIAVEVSDKLKSTYHIQLKQAEMDYLALHLNRIFRA